MYTISCMKNDSHEVQREAYRDTLLGVPAGRILSIMATGNWSILINQIHQHFLKLNRVHAQSWWGKRNLHTILRNTEAQFLHFCKTVPAFCLRSQHGSVERSKFLNHSLPEWTHKGSWWQATSSRISAKEGLPEDPNTRYLIRDPFSTCKRAGTYCKVSQLCGWARKFHEEGVDEPVSDGRRANIVYTRAKKWRGRWTMCISPSVGFLMRDLREPDGRDEGVWWWCAQ